MTADTATQAAPLRGRNALVTGASRGIGRAILLALGAAGAEARGTATSATGVASIDAALQEAGCAGGGWELDLSSPESIERLCATMKDADFAPDILVNNAGITRDGLLPRMSEDDWRLVMTVNLDAVYRLSKHCLRAMLRARRGRIVNIVSVSGRTGNPGQCNYAAAKAGVVGLSRSLAREVAARGVTVNCVAPGFIDTDMTAGFDDDARARLASAIPAGRFGAPEEVAAAVAYLASDAAAYVTGAVLDVNGGLFMG